MRKWMMLVMALMAMTVRANDAGGPKGGLLLANEAPRAEFLVNGDRKVEIRFYDDALSPVAPAEQVVTVIADAPSGKAKLAFEASGDALVSTDALPEGDGYTIIVQIKSAPDAKSQNFRIPFHTEICGECNRAEYACTCERGGEDHHDPGH